MDFLLAVLMLFIATITGIFSGEITGWVLKGNSKNKRGNQG